MPTGAHLDRGPWSLSDVELIEDILCGERALFAVLMRRHNQRVFRTVRGIVQSDDEAEDVAQHAWVAAYKALGAFRNEALFSTWVTRIAINEALSRTRRSIRSEGVVIELEVRAMQEPSPEDETYRSEVARLLEQHIDALPETLRTVFILRSVEELDTAETAAILAISEEAVRVRLLRARRTLEDRLSRLIDRSPDAFRFDGERCNRIVRGAYDLLGL
jgi:RNA polymerase sigma-70 factor (ECF subfamily)